MFQVRVSIGDPPGYTQARDRAHKCAIDLAAAIIAQGAVEDVANFVLENVMDGAASNDQPFRKVTHSRSLFTDIFPSHLNPQVCKAVMEKLWGHPSIGSAKELFRRLSLSATQEAVARLPPPAPVQSILEGDESTEEARTQICVWLQV